MAMPYFFSAEIFLWKIERYLDKQNCRKNRVFESLGKNIS